MLRTLAIQNPSLAHPLFSLGVLGRRLGDHDAAAQSLEAALSLDPTSAAAIQELAVIARAQGRLESFADAWTAAWQREPTGARAYAVALAEELRWRFSVAEEWLARSERLQRFPQQQLSRARMRLEQGLRNECIKAADGGLATARAQPHQEPVQVDLLLTRARCEYEEKARGASRPTADAALAVARSIGDAARAGDAWRAIGYAVEGPERWALFDRAVAIHEGLREEARLAEDLTAKSIFPTLPDDPKRRRQILVRAIELAQRWGDLRTELRARGTLGGYELVRGRVGAALPLLLRTHEMAKTLGSSRAEAVSAANLSEAFFLAGDLSFADDYAARALAAYRASHDDFGAALTIAGIADLAFHRGDYQASLQGHRDAVRMAGEMGRPMPALLLKLARDSQALGDLEGARERCHEVIRLGLTVSDHSEVQGAQMILAEIDLAEGRPHQAVGRFEGIANGVIGEGYEAQLSLQAQRGLARAKQQLGRPEEALGHYRRAVRWVEELRTEIPLASLRTQFFGEKRGVYLEAVDLLYELHGLDPSGGHDREAFEMAEHARARVLLELTQGRDGAVPASLERDEIKGRLSRLEARLRSGELSAPERSRLLRSRDREEKRLAEQELFSLKERPVDASASRPLGLEQIQAALPDSHLLLAFLVGQRHSYLFSVTKQRLAFHKLPGRMAVQRHVDTFRSLVTARPSNENARFRSIPAASEALAAALVGPVKPDLRSHPDVVVVPDGALFYLPFEALRMGGRYLAETHTIRYVQSASLFARPQPHDAGVAGSTLVAFGDPALGAIATRAPLLQSLERSGIALAPLPATRDEVQAIARLFAPDSVKVYLREGFNRKSVLEELGKRHRFVHLATHAILDERAPLRSGIVLSGPTGAELEGGLLQVRELADLKVPAELVTLSACQTGLGTMVDGEGILGLSRAFQEGGARNLVVSLWNVNDFSTAKFMTSFYRALRDDASPARSLARARREMLASPVSALRHPYYWASFVLIGDGS